MNIKSLEQMEKLVKENKELVWDGWTVVHTYQSDKARTSKFGRRVDGRWHLQRRFEPGNQGWEIPQRFIK